MSSIHNKCAKKFLSFPFCEIKTADPKAKVKQHWSTQRFVQRIPLKDGEQPPPLYPPTEPDNDDLESVEIDPKLQPLAPSYMFHRQLPLCNHALSSFHQQLTVNYLSEYMISRQSTRPSAMLFPTPSECQMSNYIPTIPIQPVTLIPIPDPILVKSVKPVMNLPSILNSKDLFPTPCGATENESPISSPPLINSPPPTIASPRMTLSSMKSQSPIIHKRPTYSSVLTSMANKKIVNLSQSVYSHNKIAPIYSSKAAAPVVQYPNPSLLKHSMKTIKSNVQHKAPFQNLAFPKKSHSMSCQTSTLVVPSLSSAPLPNSNTAVSKIISPISSPPLINVSPLTLSPSPTSKISSVTSSKWSRPIVILKRPRNANKTIVAVPKAPVSTQQKIVQKQHNVYLSFHQRRR